MHEFPQQTALHTSLLCLAVNELVADTADGQDVVWPCSVRLDLLAQLTNMDIHDPIDHGIPARVQMV